MVQISEIIDIFTLDFDMPSFWSEFKSIRLQIQKYLLDSLHVTAYHNLVLVILVGKPFKFLSYLNVHKYGFLFQNHINFLNSLFDIKVTYILSEFARSKLRKI